ncbi:MAG TPA: pyrroloquinoline quinone biosynthesis peptide chaperone PqqD [Longimicrobiales bacterium]
MSRFAPDSRPRLARGARLRWDEARQRHVVLFPEGALSLNATAAAVLGLCDGERTVAAIIAELEAQYPGAPVAEDVHDLLDRIAERGLLVDADA